MWQLRAEQGLVTASAWEMAPAPETSANMCWRNLIAYNLAQFFVQALAQS